MNSPLAPVQVVTNCRYLIAQLRTRENTLARNLGSPYVDNVMSFSDQVVPLQVVINCRYFIAQLWTREDTRCML